MSELNEQWMITVHNQHWQTAGGFYFVFDIHPYSGLGIEPYGTNSDLIGYWRVAADNITLQNHTRISKDAFMQNFPLPKCLDKFLDF